MHGNKKVIEQLNATLASKLTAIVQYMVQSETCQNWGYVRLGDHLKRRAIEEMGHAEGLIERHLVLGCHTKGGCRSDSQDWRQMPSTLAPKSDEPTVLIPMEQQIQQRADELYETGSRFGRLQAQCEIKGTQAKAATA